MQTDKWCALSSQVRDVECMLPLADLCIVWKLPQTSKSLWCEPVRTPQTPARLAVQFQGKTLDFIES